MIAWSGRCVRLRRSDAIRQVFVGEIVLRSVSLYGRRTSAEAHKYAAIPLDLLYASSKSSSSIAAAAATTTAAAPLWYTARITLTGLNVELVTASAGVEGASNRRA